MENESEYFQDDEIIEMEINQNIKETKHQVRIMGKACLYGSFMLLSVNLLFVVLKAIGV